jgi:ABC-type transport system involved in multi-copper enzyme maturation permease subunit
MTTTDTSTEARTPALDPSLVQPTSTPGADGRPGVPMQRLVHVELRKMVDTKAGRWMLIVMSSISLVVVGALLIWGESDEMTYGNFLGFTALPLAMLLPILGIMAATAEWSQRTGLVTFTLEPRRGRVVIAKVVAALILGLVVTAAAFVFAALANVIGAGVGDGSGAWDVTWKVGLGVVLGFAIYVLQGLAFGFVFLNTPFAIVASLLLPTVWTIAVSLVSSLAEPSKWLDLNQVTEPLFSGSMSGENWGQLSTSFGVWVLVPLLLGAWRVMHREVK